MNIAIIGATGATGLCFLDLATKAGHRVRALARNPDKLRDWEGRIEIRQADGRDPASLRAGLDPSVEVVVNIVGASNLRQARRVRDLYSKTATNLVEVMQGHGIERMVAVSSGGVEPQPNDGWFYARVFKPLFLQRMYDDMLRMEAILAASPIDAIVVRAPYLTRGEPTEDYRVSVGSVFEDDRSLRRGDLAHFLLRACTHEQWRRETIWLSE